MKQLIQLDPRDKEKIIIMINNKKDNQQILERYPQYTRQQIAATRAHIKIGSFKKVAKSITDNHKIIIEYLAKKGLNSKEILKETKFKYNPQQVAGIIAWAK